MLRRSIGPALAGASLLCLAFCLGGCASAPHLTSIELNHMGRTHVYFVKPNEDIKVVTSKTDVVKAVSTTYLFGLIGLVAYATVKGEDASEINQETMQRLQVLHAQDWPARIEAATRAALAQSPDFASAPITVLDTEPGDYTFRKMLQESGTDSVLVISPDMRIDSTADMLAITVRFHAVRMRAEVGQPSVIDDKRLLVRQDMVSVDGGKTWAQQQENGHRRHAMTVQDYSKFWFAGDPAPIKTFLDTAIPDVQQDMVFYFTDEGDPAGPLPTLQWVIQ